MTARVAVEAITALGATNRPVHDSAATTTGHGMSTAAGARRPPKLNFLIPDGPNLVASQWGNTLYSACRDAIPDCAVRGLAHCKDVDDRYRAIVIASEPITYER